MGTLGVKEELETWMSSTCLVLSQLSSTSGSLTEGPGASSSNTVQAKALISTSAVQVMSVTSSSSSMTTQPFEMSSMPISSVVSSVSSMPPKGLKVMGTAPV